MPGQSDQNVTGFRIRSFGLLALFLVLAGCNAQQGKPPAAAARPEVGVVTLHPQSVAVTAELSGRTTASLSADVRPQVGGIIQSRLFDEGGEVKAGSPDLTLANRALPNNRQRQG